MKREDRFIGHGNYTVGDPSRRVKAWRLDCCKCSKSQVIPMTTGSLPPEVIFKKFIRGGWYVSPKPDGDLCSDCRNNTRKPQWIAGAAPTDVVLAQQRDQVEQLRAENKVLKTKIETMGQATIIQGDSKYFYHRLVNAEDRIKSLTDERDRALSNDGAAVCRQLHELLINDCVEQAIQVIEARFPKWPWERRLPKKKGSLAPKHEPEVDKKFDEWLTNLQKARDNKCA
jgi:hypothetical protein